jgi:hypothetical protein
MRLLGLTVLLVLGFSGPVSLAWGGDQPQVLSLDERFRRIDQFLQARPSFLNRQSLQEFRTFAAPRRETVERVPNPHVAAETLEYRSLLFDGLEVKGLVGRTCAFSPVLVRVSSIRWTLPNGLNVGAPRGRIVKVLGAPMKSTDATLAYQGTSDQVTFRVGRDVIAEVTLQYYSD